MPIPFISAWVECNFHGEYNTSTDKYTFQSFNRPFSYSEKNPNQTILSYILQKFRMCTIVIKALTPLDQISRVKVYKNYARSRLFCRIAKRSIAEHGVSPPAMEVPLCCQIIRCLLSAGCEHNHIIYPIFCSLLRLFLPCKAYKYSRDISFPSIMEKFLHIIYNPVIIFFGDTFGSSYAA